MGTVGVGELQQWGKEEVGGDGEGGKEEKIFVSVRIRPLNGKELERNDPSDWDCINNTTIIFKNSVPERSMYPTAYAFDRVFGFDSSTRQVYVEGAKEVALSVVNGINSSVFAYGQTSSGKTYTMSGITEYAVADIYDYINKHKEREFVLKFSAMEIYNESVRDLLSMDSSPLRLLDDPERGTIVEKLTEEILQDESHFKELLSVCEAQRQIGETSLNEMSSRSHQILKLTIESSAREYMGKVSSSTLTATVNFVDLAGSERASQALSAGARLKEGCHINRSLLTLGTVIRKLSKGRNGHIPFRDSKLTRILQSSLGGNARTAIICTMSPARSHIEQSRNTLLFASCAKEVVTSAHVNVVMSDKALVKYLQRELARLENELRYPSCAPHYETIRDKDTQIKKLEQEIKELMVQRDLAQSRLEDLLRGVRDDQPSNQWDESCQLSISDARNASEAELSFSGFSGNQYMDFGSARHHKPDKSKSCDAYCFQLSDGIEDQHLSPSHSISSSTSIGIIPRKGIAKNDEAIIDDSEDNYKDVRCIEIHELRMSSSEEFNLHLTDENDSLRPSAEEDKLGNAEMPSVCNVHSSHAEKQQLGRLTRTNDKSSRWLSEQKAINLKDLVLNKSRSCKASLMATPDTWLEELEQDIAKQAKEISTNSSLKELFVKPSILHIDAEKEALSFQVPQTSEESSLTKVSLTQDNQSCLNEFCVNPSTLHSDAEKEALSLHVPQSSEGSIFSKVSFTQDNRSATEEDVANIHNLSVELSGTSQSLYQKHLSYDKGTQAMESEEGTEEMIKDLGIDSMQSSDAPPSTWPLEFERKQLEIIELWHTCNVSLFHRTCFFLLFKGDPADAFYMEVEHRRLSFLRSSTSQGCLSDVGAKENNTDNLMSSLKHLRRERDMLYRQMLKKLNQDEKQDFYIKWGIDLNSKQRRLQISRLIWTETDMDHVKESASLVAKLVGLLGQAPKEMFGLSFMPQLMSNRLFSCRHANSSFM